ncbi:hypothetical protein BGX21_000358 [Mortierella sp. AD011]|nr:hypothetical protein BGX20_000250 [Mortierella sp. AD010]KAF9401848.1 hypothetical protein BGX21_000358 [Mortierella sp. AD011]
MNQIPGTRTTTKTTTVNGVTTVVTTVMTPGQPTRVTTTTTSTTKVPAGQKPSGSPKLPAQPLQPQPQPQGRQQTQFEPDFKRKSGFFSSLKKHVLRNDEQQQQPQQSQPQPHQPKLKTLFQKITSQQGPQQKPAPIPQQRPVPVPQQRPTPIPQQAPVPVPQQRPAPIPQQAPVPVFQQMPAPVPQQKPQPPTPSPVPVPVPVTVIHHSTDDGPVDQLAEKMRLATLNRPNVSVEHHTHSVTTQNGRIVQESDNTSYSGDIPDDAISLLKRSQPVCAPEFKGERLDVDAIDFSREDALARGCPNSETVSIDRLSHYLTSPCAGDQVSQLRTIFTWLANNISYDVPSFLAGRYGDQSAEAVLRSRKAVCEGYANLFVALAQPAGLNVEKIIGLARGVDIQVGDDRLGSPHAWNAVRVDGEYLLIDATWGAGVCDLSTRSFRKLFRPFFFLLRPSRLIYTHWPENPKQQYLEPPIDERVFRGLPAIKPEAWGLGIKPSGKHRGQIVRTNDDSIEVEVRLKRKGPNRSTGKIVARLNWKGQAVPTNVQWLREDAKYVYMIVKAWCPSAGAGELHIFGWPPGGDQTKNGPQCMCFKVVNEGSGRAARPALQQYVVKGFSFSVLEPMFAQVKKGVPQTIRVRVFDVEKGVTPALAIQSPEGGMPERMPQVEPGMFEIQKVLIGGQWKIVHMTSEYGFSFAAVFDAV